MLVVIRVGFCQTSHRNSVVNHHCYGKKKQNQINTEVKMSVQTKKNWTNLEKNILLRLQKAMIWLNHYHLQREKNNKNNNKTVTQWINKYNKLQKNKICLRSTCSAADPSKTHLKEIMWSVDELWRKKMRWDTAYSGTCPNGMHSTDRYDSWK